MSYFRIDENRLINHKNVILKEQKKMVERTADLRNRFVNYEWDDNISNMTKESLNRYFDAFNVNMAILENALADIEIILKDVNNYKRSV